ncbi:MAG TPA: isoprenylcysteine carboxylmethyltransferase family protein [Pyrinomonadaceae bacterium]
MQRWRVPLGFVCAGVFLLLAAPRAATLAVGGVIALAGLAVRAWSSGHIRKNDALAVSGPYAHTRNPLYFGSLLIGVGFTVAASGRWWLLPVLGGVFAALFFGIYLTVMRVEAATLARLFGEDYERYARNVPLLVPRLTPYDDGRGSRLKFDAGLYMRYREYRAAIGLLAAWGLLALKSFLLRWIF